MAEQTPLERAARALCRSRGIDPDSNYQPQSGGATLEVALPQPAWRQWERNARAAIEAIREPSEEMAHHGQGAILERWIHAEGPDVDSAKASWQAMIDQLLAEG